MEKLEVQKVIEEAVKQGHMVVVGKNRKGEPIYRLTREGQDADLEGMDCENRLPI